MSVFRSGDPVADFKRWEQEQREWEDRLPCCECCGEPQDTYIFDIDEEALCLECVKNKYGRSVG